jgi:hypothetical protein
MRDGALLTADCRRIAKGAIFMSAWKQSPGGGNDGRVVPPWFPSSITIPTTLASFFWFQMIELGEKARRLAKLTPPPALGLQ